MVRNDCKIKSNARKYAPEHPRLKNKYINVPHNVTFTLPLVDAAPGLFFAKTVRLLTLSVIRVYGPDGNSV